MFSEFAHRSYELERIDTGQYTPEEYDQFLADIRQVNRFAGDNWTLRATLFREIERADLPEFSVLDLGAGSGELLRTCAEFGRKTNRRARLYGLELSERSSRAINEESSDYHEIFPVRGNALDLPFEENSFDYVICSLFTHHFLEKDIESILSGMARLSRRKIFVIDLHRHPAASFLYKIFCSVFVKGILVKTDGALSIKRGFKPSELESLARKINLVSVRVERHFPYRLVLEADAYRS
ncbi:MAG: methyltransferase domain-containing protein [Acidobacteriota bacterium]|nr:methyltransferase domain-containing protein [Acidobacteriota bacterium]